MESNLRAIDPAAAAHLGRLFRRARQFCHEAHVAGAMALTGPGPLTADDLAALDLSSADQDNYFAQFQAQLLASPPDGLAANRSLGGGSMSVDQAIARFGQYGRDIWARGVNWLRNKFRRQGNKPEERRILGPTESGHCEECPPLADMGWQGIGTLPAIGDTPCQTNCACRFTYR